MYLNFYIVCTIIFKKHHFFLLFLNWKIEKHVLECSYYLTKILDVTIEGIIISIDIVWLTLLVVFAT